MPYPKFEHIDVIWDLPENCPEAAHVQTVLRCLERHLVDLGFAESFVFMATTRAENISVPEGARLVVYQIGGVDHEIPTYANDVFMLFKNYGAFYPLPDNVRILPLGCSQTTPSLPVQPMTERATALFFVGQEDHREDFFKAMDGYDLTAHPRRQIEIARCLGPGQHYTPEVYGHKMAQSKVALCPRGVSHETLRLYEAMRAGCVVIAARQLASWFTAGWPVIEIDDWGEFNAVADDLLADEARMQDLSRQTRAWWESHCSEEAVAHYIAGALSVSLMKQNL